MKKLLLLCIPLFLMGNDIIAQGVWTQKAGFPLASISEARAFAIGNYGYVGGPTPELWRYDPAGDTWTQMATFIGATRLSPAAFSIGNKGYIGTGGGLNDFYEYDAVANTWTAKANFGGAGREGALGISINDKGYIGTGGNYMNDWWEYDTTANVWTQKANLAGPGRYHGGAFAINGKGYISTGFNGAFFNDLWEYDPILNTWTAKAQMPGTTRDRPIGTATSSRGYIVTGWTGNASLNDGWEYDPVADAWTALPVMPCPGRYNAFSFAVNNKIYLGTGFGGLGGDFWEFGPSCIVSTSTQATACNGGCTGSATVSIPAPGAVTTYVWSDGQTTQTALNLCAGTYTVTVTDTTGCISISTVVISEPPPIQITAIGTPPLCNGGSGQVCVFASVSPVTYLWFNGDTSSCLLNVMAGSYMVTVTDSMGCSNSDTFTVSQPGALIMNMNSIDASCGTCADGTASVQLFGGTPPMTYLWSTGGTSSFIMNVLPGWYSCCVTDANGCTACDSVFVDAPIGLNDPDGKMLIISPNPFSDELVIQNLDASSGAVELKLFDENGKMSEIKPLRFDKKIIIPTDKLNAGIYFLEVKMGSDVKSFKVLKN